MEGKSVLSFYLNQTSFDSVAQGECKLMKVQLVVVCLYHFFSLICSDLSIDRDHLWGHTYKPTILPLAVREQIQCTDSIGNPRRSSNRDHRGHNRAGKYNQCDQGSAACLANRYAILELFAVSVFDLQPLPELWAPNQTRAGIPGIPSVALGTAVQGSSKEYWVSIVWRRNAKSIRCPN